MKHRVTITALGVLGGFGLWVCWPGAPGASAAGPRAGAEVAAFETQEEPAYTYVGIKKCKSCHLDVHKSWAQTAMGKAFETLKPGHAKEAKEKAGFDPNKDYTTDAKCLKCHTTGFGKPGGYETPEPGDRRAARKAKDFQGVGCESCHGPGSGYVKVFEEIDESKRTYTVEELYAVGMRKIDKDACISCHNEEAGTSDPENPFDFDKIMKEEETAKGKAIRLHVRKPLELRAK